MNKRQRERKQAWLEFLIGVALTGVVAAYAAVSIVLKTCCKVVVP